MEYLFSHTPLTFFVQDFWRDEAFSYLLAKEGFFRIAFLSIQDFTPPLYYFLLKIWMAIFGASEIALRSLSLLFFILALFTAFHFLLDVFKFNHRQSFIGMLLFLINPILLYYAFEARAYSMFAFLTLLSFYAFLTGKKRLYYTATLAGLFTHYFMVFAVAIQIIYAVFIHRGGMRNRLRWAYISSAVFSPWLLFALIQKLATSTSFWIEKVRLSDLFYLPAVIYAGYEKDFDFPRLNSHGYPPVIGLLSFALFLLIAWAVVFIKKRGDLHKTRDPAYDRLMLFLMWALAPTILIFIISFVKPLYLPRYLIFCTPGFIFLIIQIMMIVRNPLKWMLLAAIVLMSFNYNNLQIKYRKKARVAPVFREISALAKGNDVVYTDELNFFLAEYYLKNDRVYIYLKDYKEIPKYVGKVLIPPDRIRNTLPTYPAKAFIFKGSGYDIQTMY